MEIHELNTFSGTPGAGDFFATDNGTDTSKVSAEAMFAPLNARIDNIIAGPAPSAEEIIDARLGADGVTYPLLGDAIRDQVSDLKSEIIEELTINIDDVRDAFVSTNIGGHVYYSTSTKTKTLVKVIRVFKGKTYFIHVTNSSTPAGTNARTSAIIDSDDIVRQVLENIVTTAGATDVYKFTSNYDGYLSLSIDANYTAVSIAGAKFYEELKDTEKNLQALTDVFLHSMSLDLTRHLNAYPSEQINSKVNFSASSATLSYQNIVPVIKDKEYEIRVTNSNSPASTGNRTSVMVDENNIVRQTITVPTTAGTTNAVKFTASTNGYLILAIDKNYTNIDIIGYEVLSQTYKNAQNISKLTQRVLYRNAITVQAGGAVRDENEIVFKAKHTYVLVVDTDASEYEVQMGISGTDMAIQLSPHDGMDVLKFTIGDTDVLSHLFVYNLSSSSRTVSYVCEEWDEQYQWTFAEPDTIRVAARNSIAKDKYISNYICDGTDDQIEIQKAINELATTGGKVVLCDGNYYISTLTDSENDEIGYIGIEIPNNPDPSIPELKHYIAIEGVSKPIRVSGYIVGRGATITLAQSAVSSLSPTQHITLIGALPVDNELQRIARGINLTIKNVGINIPRNDMAIRCIDAEYCSALEIENVCIGMSTDTVDISNPSPDCIGIRGLGGWNYGVYYIMRCVKILGMGVAFDLGGEHLLMEQCAVRYSDIPYRFYGYGDVSKMAHAQTLINCTEEFCMKSFVFGANSNKPNISIIDHNIEWRYEEWGRNQKAIELHPGDIRGNINFSIDHIGYENTSDAQFWESGSGLNVKTINNTDLFIGTTAERPPYPNRAQQYFDTTIGKLLIYDGSNWV